MPDPVDLSTVTNAPWEIVLPVFATALVLVFQFVVKPVIEVIRDRGLPISVGNGNGNGKIKCPSDVCLAQFATLKDEVRETRRTADRTEKWHTNVSNPDQAAEKVLLGVKELSQVVGGLATVVSKNTKDVTDGVHRIIDSSASLHLEIEHLITELREGDRGR